ncbi:RidA family protein [Kineococcus glutinatus]|uniref:RidA family protein n=1 Tax=Kineococcus glutinatus TaxID=1070872 RepID=A0ABP9I4Z5_9ACTN
MSGPGSAAAGGRVAARLAGLGLRLPQVAAPLASYRPAVRDGDLVWTAGQLPLVDGRLPRTGRVGEGEGLVPPAEATGLARTCALNALAAVASVVGDLDAVERVVKVVGFIASDPAFTGQPAVLNGASDLLAEVFGDAGHHARSAVGVAVLPLGAPVEVELVVRVR